MERMSNLAEKIYVSIYGVERYAQEICKLIYGDSKNPQQVIGAPQVHREIKKLEENKWIYRIDWHPEEKDERARRRIYYSTNNEILVKIVFNELKKHKKKLTRNEEIVLKNFLSSNDFKLLFYAYYTFVIEKNVDLIRDSRGIEFILDFICYECLQRLCFKKLTKQLHDGAKDNSEDIQLYDSWSKNFIFSGKFPKFLDDLLMEKLCNISNNAPVMNYYFSNVSEHMVNQILLLNEFKQQNKKPVMIYSLIHPDFYKFNKEDFQKK